LFPDIFADSVNEGLIVDETMVSGLDWDDACDEVAGIADDEIEGISDWDDLRE
jgi:hypothetical protein